MAEFKFFCARCGSHIACDIGYRGLQINCPVCQGLITVPQDSNLSAAPPARTGNAPAGGSPLGGTKWKALTFASSIAVLLGLIAVMLWFLNSNKLPRGVPRTGLTAYWTANGSAKDLVGSNTCVLLNGARFSHGALELNNTAGMKLSRRSSTFPPPAYDGGAFVQVKDSDGPILGNGDFTIELWANFDAVPVFDVGHAQGGVFVSKDEGPYNVNKWVFWLSGGVLDFHINDPQRGPVFLVRAPFRPRIKQWYHFALTRRQNVFTIYVNGNAIGSETSDRPIPHVNAPLRIGEAEGYYFNGRLNDIGIFHRALSSDEVKNIFNKGAHR